MTNKDIDYNNINGSDGVTENITEKVQNLSVAQTDMLFQYLANPDKYKNKDKIAYYDKNDDFYNRSAKNLSDNIDDYIKKDKYSEKTDRHDDNDDEYVDIRSERKYSDRKYSEKSSDKPKPRFKNKEDEIIAKLDILRQLGELKNVGVTISRNYGLNDDLSTMEYELSLHRNIRQKSNGIKWLENLMLNSIYGIELFNDTFDPFGFKLNGWHDQMNSDSDEYYDVLGELYEKYFSSGGSFPCELKLAFIIGQSAIRHHTSHKKLDNLPTMSSEMEKNKELKEQLRQQGNKRREELHNDATDKVDRIHELKNYRREAGLDTQSNISKKTVVENQIREKEMELDKLYKQLQLERSDAMSMFTNNTVKTSPSMMNQKILKMPHIPQSLRDFRQDVPISKSKQPNTINIEPDVDDILEKSINASKSASGMSDKTSIEESVYTTDSKGLPKKRGRKKKTVLRFDTSV